MRYLIPLVGIGLLILTPFTACMDFGGGEAEGCNLPECIGSACDDPCRGVVCPADSNECTQEYCSGGTCRSSAVADRTPCTYDGLEGICVKGVCGEDLCEGVVCEDTDPCVEGTCNYVDGTCEFAPALCDDHEACTEDSCDPVDGCIFTAVEDGTRCGGTGGVCKSGVCMEPEYTQDFESLDRVSPTALSDDGWVIFGNVFAADGETYLYGYGAFPAPNGGESFCAIDTWQGGPEQGDQQLSIYSDYDNFDEQMAGNRVQANTYRERVITARDIGKAVTFSFDARRGNINDSGDAACIDTPNPPCDSTANAFIRTVDPKAGYAVTNSVEEETTTIPETWDRYSISMEIEPGLVDQLLQFGFSATASNFEPSGVFYDNIVVEPAPP